MSVRTGFGPAERVEEGVMGPNARIAIAAAVLSLTATSAVSQTVTPIDFPGAMDTRPLGINASGEIVGQYADATGIHGFLLDRKGFSSIDVPGAVQTTAFRINPQGDIVGFYVPPTGLPRSFLWTQGTFYDVLPEAVLSAAHGVNARGQIVGQYNDTPGIPQHGFLLSRGILTVIDHPDAVRTTAFDINERGDILGAYAGAAGTRLYVLSSGVFTTIEVPGTLGTLGPGPAGSFAGINAKGEIVGAYQADGKIRGFVRDTSGFFTTIDFVDTMFVRATGINPQGDIVGYYRDLAGRDHGFLLRR
jgi:hypothetical protein